MRIGIVIVATNLYFVLGILFIKQFKHFYKGNCKIRFYFFSDTNPEGYLPEGIDYQFIETSHRTWVDGTNSKFRNILSLDSAVTDCDYIYYFDADTSIDKEFTEEWFIGDLVGGEHYGNKTFGDQIPYDRNPKSKAYIPHETTLPKTYFYGAFFGGKTEKVLEFCKQLRENQLADQIIKYEPGVNDESYINQYFHFTPPTRTVPCTEFAFLISDKAGIIKGRDNLNNIDVYKKMLLDNKDSIKLKTNT